MSQQLSTSWLILYFESKWRVIYLEQKSISVCVTYVVEGRVVMTLAGLTRHICVPVPSRDLDFQRHMSWFFFVCVHLIKMSGDCSFRRYLWNCWPSSFKLYVHDFSLSIVMFYCLWAVRFLSPSLWHLYFRLFALHVFVLLFVTSVDVISFIIYHNLSPGL